MKMLQHIAIGLVLAMLLCSVTDRPSELFRDERSMMLICRLESGEDQFLLDGTSGMLTKHEESEKVEMSQTPCAVDSKNKTYSNSSYLSHLRSTIPLIHDASLEWNGTRLRCGPETKMDPDADGNPETELSKAGDLSVENYETLEALCTTNDGAKFVIEFMDIDKRRTGSCIKEHPVVDFHNSWLGTMCADGSKRMYNEIKALICTKCCPGYTWDDRTKHCTACGDDFTNDEATVFANSCDKPLKTEVVVDPSLQPVVHPTPAVTPSSPTTTGTSTVPTKATMTAETTVETTDGTTSIVMRTNPEVTDQSQTVTMEDVTKSKEISTDTEMSKNFRGMLIVIGIVAIPAVLLVIAVLVQHVRQKRCKSAHSRNRRSDEETPLEDGNVENGM